MSVINKSQLTLLIDSLSDQLQKLGLWSTTTPSKEYLLSEQPFCCDYLRLEAWLQFVFIPKIKELLLGDDLALFQCSIHPIVEESFKQVSNDISELMSVIKSIDETLSGDA